MKSAVSIRLINVDGELWGPVEITLIGKTGFLKACKKGADQWNAHEKTPENKMMYITSRAKEVYRPIGLTENDLGLQYGSGEAIAASFLKEIDTLSSAILDDYYRAVSKQRIKKTITGLASPWQTSTIIQRQRELLKPPLIGTGII